MAATSTFAFTTFCLYGKDESTDLSILLIFVLDVTVPVLYQVVCQKRELVIV